MPWSLRARDKWRFGLDRWKWKESSEENDAILLRDERIGRPKSRTPTDARVLYPPDKLEKSGAPPVYSEGASL